MKVSSFTFALVTCFTCLVNSWLHAAVGISPYFEPNAIPQDVVGLRYSTRIDDVEPGDNIVILFGGMKFYAPGQRKIHTIEANLYNYWVEYSDTGSVPWPPARNGTAHHNQGALWVSVADYNREGFVGLRHCGAATLKLFPRMNSGIDNIAGITKIETISQQNMVGKDIYVEVTKGDVQEFDSPQSGWGGRYRLEAGKQVSSEEMPAGTYQIWKVRVAFDGRHYAWEAAFPAEQARYFAPHQIIHFVTEFFEMRSKFCAYIWNPQLLREGESQWEDLARWKYHYQAGPDPYGPRLADVNGRHVLEMSNDKPPESYFKKEAIFELQMNPTVQWQCSESRATQGQQTARITAVMDRPADQDVEVHVLVNRSANRAADDSGCEQVSFVIPAGKKVANPELSLGNRFSESTDAPITLTLISASPAAIAGRITHIVMVDPAK